MVSNIYREFLSTVQAGDPRAGVPGITNPYGLAAVAATGQAESGFSPANAYRQWSDPSERGAPGMAGGVMSWRAERLDRMRQHAAAIGDDPDRPSPAAQASYFLAEDPQLVASLQSAGSVEEAQGLMNRAWRFAGYDRPGGEAARRQALARDFLPRVAGGEMPEGDYEDVASSTSMADIPREGSPMKTNPGGLGGLGGYALPAEEEPVGGLRGFLSSEAGGNLLQAFGSSLLTSPSNNPLQNMAKYIDHYEERSEKRRTKKEEEDALVGALRAAGLTPEEAAQYARNPAAAKMVVDLRSAEREKQENQTFMQGLTSSGASSYGDYLAEADPIGGAPSQDAGLVGGLSASTRSTLMQPAPLGQQMPDRTAGSAPPTPASASTNKTWERRDRLYADEDRLLRAAMGATNDDQRQAAELALEGVRAQIARVDKLVERIDEIPNLETFYDEPTGLEYKGYLDPQTKQPVRVGGLKAPSNSNGVTIGPDGTVQIGGAGGGKIPSGFMVDPSNPGALTPIPGGPGEQIPGELAARIGLADNFIGRAPQLRERLVGGEASGPLDVWQARNNQSSPQAEVHRELEYGVEALVRMLTGAGMNMSEAEERARRYLPTYTDNAQSMTSKLDGLTDYLRSSREMAMRGRGGTSPSVAAPGVGGSTGTASNGLKWSVE